jgi:hypothetical protein
MQFKPWHEFYEENKDHITDKEEAYQEWCRIQRKFLETVASSQFKYVGDEGLFPNHTDEDIWINGFMAGYKYKQK